MKQFGTSEPSFFLCLTDVLCAKSFKLLSCKKCWNASTLRWPWYLTFWRWINQMSINCRISPITNFWTPTTIILKQREVESVKQTEWKRNGSGWALSYDIPMNISRCYNEAAVEQEYYSLIHSFIYLLRMTSTNKTVCNAMWAGQQGSKTNTNSCPLY